MVFLKNLNVGDRVTDSDTGDVWTVTKVSDKKLFYITVHMISDDGCKMYCASHHDVPFKELKKPKL